MIDSTNTESQNDKNDITKLPFVSDIKEGEEIKRCFWQVKGEGNYKKDLATGECYAKEAMYYMLKHKAPHLLGWCILDMPRKGDHSGIEIGFLTTIARYAMGIRNLPTV